MDFNQVFKILIKAFKKENIDFALMGGMALQAVGLNRTTGDIDLLVLSKDSKEIKEIMFRQGYDLIHESEDVLNFIGRNLELGRVDFLLAHRKYTLTMLQNAQEKPIFKGKFEVKVLRIEDIIGLKVQATSNNPQRLYQDMADIRLLIKNNLSTIDMNLVREYFALFNKEKELDNLLREINNA